MNVMSGIRRSFTLSLISLVSAGVAVPVSVSAQDTFSIHNLTTRHPRNAKQKVVETGENELYPDTMPTSLHLVGGDAEIPENENLRFPEDVQRRKLLESTRLIYFGKGPEAAHDSVMSLMSKFYFDQYRHFQDPHAPYFMFMSKDGNLSMGIGGVVRMRGWFDWNGSVPANGFSTYAIPIPKVPTDMRRLGATPAGTALFYTIIGRNTVIGDYMGYIEANFDGYQHIGFKLKKAYFTVGDWTAGYATSTFSDPAAEPITIDGAGANGKMLKTTVLVRYLHTFRGHWSVGGSFEFPSSSPDVDNTHTAKCTDYVPDIAAMGQYQWDGGLSHVRLAGLFRVLPYRDLLTSTNHNVIGWGVQASTVVKVIPNLSLYGIAGIGQGHASYTGDLSSGSFDLVAKAGNPGELYAPTALSLIFGAKYNFTPSVYASVALSELRYLPRTNPGNSQYKYGLYGACSLFWEITPRFQIGAEYLAGKRANFNHTCGNANRVDALFQLSF